MVTLLVSYRCNKINFLKDIIYGNGVMQVERAPINMSDIRKIQDEIVRDFEGKWFVN